MEVMRENWRKLTRKKENEDNIETKGGKQSALKCKERGPAKKKLGKRTKKMIIRHW